VRPADNPPNSDGLGVYHGTVPEWAVRVYWRPGPPIWPRFGLDPDPDPKWRSGTVANTSHYLFCPFRQQLCWFWVNTVAQPVNCRRRTTKHRWCSIDASLTVSGWWLLGDCHDVVASMFAYSGGQSTDHGLISLYSPWIIHDARPKIVDNVLMFIFR